MIYIVHGDDFTKSRNLVLNQQKNLDVETRTELEIGNLTPEEIYSLTHSSGLFGEGQFLVLNISKAGHTNLDPFIEKLTKIPDNIILIILSDKSLSGTNTFIKNASKLNAKIILNQKVPLSNTFKFIDAVFYKQRDTAYRELSKLTDDRVDSLEIFSMILWGLRNVAQAKFENKKFFSGRDFVKNKANTQSKLFTTESIKSLFSVFSNMDKELKTGGLDVGLLVPMAVEKVLNS